MGCHALQPFLPFFLGSPKAFGIHLGFVARFAGRCRSSGTCDKAPTPGRRGQKRQRGCESDQTPDSTGMTLDPEDSGCQRPSPGQCQTHREMLDSLLLTVRSQKVAPFPSAPGESIRSCASAKRLLLRGFAEKQEQL